MEHLFRGWVWKKEMAVDRASEKTTYQLPFHVTCRSFHWSIFVGQKKKKSTMLNNFSHTVIFIKWINIRWKLGKICEEQKQTWWCYSSGFWCFADLLADSIHHSENSNITSTSTFHVNQYFALNLSCVHLRFPLEFAVGILTPPEATYIAYAVSMLYCNTYLLLETSLWFPCVQKSANFLYLGWLYRSSLNAQ
jgi:hypothetical protein